MAFDILRRAPQFFRGIVIEKIANLLLSDHHQMILKLSGGCNI